MHTFLLILYNITKTKNYTNHNLQLSSSKVIVKILHIFIILKRLISRVEGAEEKEGL
jgi:hypothetical protein